MTVALTYHGEECKRCGNDDRYSSSNKCVFCTRKREKEYRKNGLRKEAHEVGGLPRPEKFTYAPLATPDFRKHNKSGKLL